MEKQKLKERKINKKSHFTLHTSSNSGITLVALIITIIVLLILAVVAIRAVQGDGIITKAKEAKSKTTVAQEKEQIGLAANEWRIQKNYQNEPSTNFKSFMIATLTNADSIEGDPAGPLTVIMNGTRNEYIVQENGVVINLKEIDTPITYFEYEVNSENEITIKGLSEEGIAAINSGTTIFKIPSVIEGKTVTQIGDEAFAGVDISAAMSGQMIFLPAENITHIILPDTLKTIGDYAFTYTKLSTINLPDSLITIGSSAFWYTQLSTVQIPESVTTIGMGAFHNAQLTGIVEISSSRVTTMGASVFGNNNNLKVKVDFASSDIRPEGWDTDWNDRKLYYLYRCRNRLLKLIRF